MMYMYYSAYIGHEFHILFKPLALEREDKIAKFGFRYLGIVPEVCSDCNSMYTYNVL